MLAFQRALQATRSVINPLDIESFGSEIFRNQATKLYIVVNDKNLIHGFASSTHFIFTTLARIKA
jgi:hypothetical protein